MPRLAPSLVLAVLLAILATSGAGAATLEPLGGSAEPDEFDQPIFVTSDPGDSSRVFVVEREGRVAEVDGEAAPRLYADLTGFVTCCSGERGLLSIAPAPDFHKSGVFYAAYTGESGVGGANLGDIHVDAFVADADAEVTRTPTVTVGHTPESNHNGGQIQFGPDGYLYISTGDGGGGGDPFETGQDLSSLLGKILRIDPHPGSTPAYSIPPDNPFAGVIAGADQIWSYGLRNPWRFSFDSLTGDMVIGDVGQNLHEEVDFARRPVAGFGGREANYGWSCREGLFAYTDATPTMNCPTGGFTDPVFDYPHTDPDPPADRAYGCSITGGYVVRDPSLTDLYGRYVYADYCTSEIRSLLLPELGDDTAGDDRSAGIATPTSNPVSFGEDSCHRLYIASGSTVYRFDGVAPVTCPPPEKEDEEAPTFPPLIPVAPVTQIPNPFTPSPPPPSPAPTVSLEADDLGYGSYRLRVQVSACEPSDIDSIGLNCGGRHLARVAANRGCAARFRVHLDGRGATFRALFWSDPEATPVRSRRLRVG